MSAEGGGTRASRLRELTTEYRALAAKLREGGGPARVAKMHEQGKLSPRERVTALLDPGAPARDRPADRARPVRWPGAGRRRHHRRGRGGRAGGGGRRQRRHGEGRRLVARDHPEDAAGPGDRDAAAHPDHLPGGQRGRESPLSGRRLSRPVRRGPPVLLQRHHAALSQRAADRRRDGKLRRGRGVSAGPLRRDLHGRGHQLHGAGRPQPGEGRHRADGRRRDPGRRAHPHRDQRGGALPRRQRCRVPRGDAGVRGPAARPGRHQAPRHARRSARRDRAPSSTKSSRRTTACPTTCTRCWPAFSTPVR